MLVESHSLPDLYETPRDVSIQTRFLISVVAWDRFVFVFEAIGVSLSSSEPSARTVLLLPSEEIDSDDESDSSESPARMAVLYAEAIFSGCGRVG